MTCILMKKWNFEYSAERMPCKNTEIQRHKGRQPWEDRGRDWNYSVIARKCPGLTEDEETTPRGCRGA